jgi:hypothetical protein
VGRKAKGPNLRVTAGWQPVAEADVAIKTHTDSSVSAAFSCPAEMPGFLIHLL